MRNNYNWLRVVTVKEWLDSDSVLKEKLRVLDWLWGVREGVE